VAASKFHWLALTPDRFLLFGPKSAEDNMARILVFASLAFAVAMQLVGNATAQPVYPTRPVRLILPFNPASAIDITARMFADRLSARWGKPVVVENRPGGDGLVSLQAFNAADDDHTLWLGPVGIFTVLPYVHDDAVPFDLKSRLVPIVNVSDVVLAVSVPASSSVTSIDQLVALAKAQPGKLNAAAAQGMADFLLFGWIKDRGLQIVKVPYRDIMQAPNDLAEDRIQVLATSFAVVQPLMKAGKVRVLAITGRQRATFAPGIPAAAEAGYPDLTFESAGGIFGPPGMSDAVREKIAADVRDVSTDPVVAQRIAEIGTTMDIQGPKQFAATVQSERDRVAAIAKVLGLTAH
jgi:tripartite-type tricarboxylate transporter receptor subunit TctC